MLQAKLLHHVEKPADRAMDRVAGIDPSLARGCAVGVIDFVKDVTVVKTFPTPKPKPESDDYLVVLQAAEIIGYLEMLGVEVVGVEDQFAPLGGGKSEKLEEFLKRYGATEIPEHSASDVRVSVSTKRERNEQKGMAQAMARLSQFSGALRALLLSAGLEPVKIAPATGKKAITGSGRASQDEVHRAALELYGERGLEGKCSIDEAHALGVGLAAEQKVRTGPQ